MENCQKSKGRGRSSYERGEKGKGRRVNEEKDELLGPGPDGSREGQAKS